MRPVRGDENLNTVMCCFVQRFKEPQLKKTVKGRLVRLFQHCIRRLIILLPQISYFIHLQRRHASHRRERPLLGKEGTISKEFSQQIRTLRKYQVLLHAAKLRHGTDSFASPPKESMLRIIRTPEKSNGFGRVRSRDSGTRGQHANHQTTEAADRLVNIFETTSTKTYMQVRFL